MSDDTGKPDASPLIQSTGSDFANPIGRNPVRGMRESVIIIDDAGGWNPDEIDSIYSQNVERSRGFSRCDPRLVGSGLIEVSGPEMSPNLVYISGW